MKLPYEKRSPQINDLILYFKEIEKQNPSFAKGMKY
jgi:hypothetical protein